MFALTGALHVGVVQQDLELPKDEGAPVLLHNTLSSSAACDANTSVGTMYLEHNVSHIHKELRSRYT